MVTDTRLAELDARIEKLRAQRDARAARVKHAARLLAARRWNYLGPRFDALVADGDEQARAMAERLTANVPARYVKLFEDWDWLPKPAPASAQSGEGEGK